MKQSEKKFEGEEIDPKKLGQCIHTSFGHLIRTLRLASPLSHDALYKISSLNSSSIWRLEHESSFLITNFIEAAHHYFKSLKCKFNLHRLCQQIERSMHSGKCLVVTEVDFSDLDKYDPSQIILSQRSDDTEEQQRRAKRTQKTAHIMKKRGDRKWKDKTTNITQPEKKKKKH